MRSLLVSLALCVVAEAAPRTWETLPLPPAMPAPRVSGTVLVDGAKLWWGEWGAADKPVVVLLHGGMGNSDHWAFQLPALEQSFRVVAIDSRGQGRSELAGKLSYARMADDVIAVLDAKRIAKASFVGWSDGGSIALKLAVTRPERVERLFVIGTNYSSAGSKPRKKTKPSQTFNRYAAKCKADFLRFGKKPAQWQPMISALLPVWRSHGTFTREQLAGIQAPTLIALGAHDEIIQRAEIEEMGKLIPQGRAVIFEELSHFALWQDPKTVNKALVAFLAAR